MDQNEYRSVLSEEDEKIREYIQKYEREGKPMPPLPPEYYELEKQLVAVGDADDLHKIVDMALSTENMSEEEAQPIKDKINAMLKQDDEILKKMKRLHLELFEKAEKDGN